MDEPTALGRLRADPGLRVAVKTARAWGVPLSRLMGREPAQRIVRDRFNVPARIESEPEWTQDDRDLAIALTLYEADACPGCGQPLCETTRPEREGRYKAGLAVRCHHCTAAAIGGEKYAESPQSSALLIPVEYVP
jgi:hypothetical protein